MLIALLLAAGAQAPATDRVPIAERVDGPPGSWAEYLVRSRGRPQARVRVTVLAAAGKGRVWLEVASADTQGAAAAIKVLVRRGTRLTVERMYVMLAGQQPIEVPPAAIGSTALRIGGRSVQLLASGQSGGHSVFPKGWEEDPGGAVQGKGSESAK